MPTRMKFVCQQIDCSLKTRGRDLIPTATITFSPVPNDRMNSWFTQDMSGLKIQQSLQITTTDPVAVQAYQVGKHYVFSIDDYVETAEDRDERPVNQVNPFLDEVAPRNDPFRLLEPNLFRIHGRQQPMPVDFGAGVDDATKIALAREIASCFTRRTLSAAEATERLTALGVAHTYGPAGITIL